MPRICLLALIGLPAAGKTCLSNWLLEHQASLSDWNILHLCYDDYFDVQSTNEAYSEQRNHIFELLSQLIDNLGVKNATVLPSKVRRAATTNNTDNYLIICDDNHYYRSMRYKLYQLCRAKGCIYAQVYICKPVAACLQANVARGASVPEAIIQQMHARLEAPSDNAWECNSLTLNELDFDAMCEFIKTLIHCQPDEQTAVAHVKQTQLQSLAHQLDLLLRARIQTHMHNWDFDSKQTQIQSLSKTARSRALNEKRKQILAQFRQHIKHKQQSGAVDLEYYVNLLN